MAQPPREMDKHLLRIFELRVEEQCLAALQAANDLSMAVARASASASHPSDTTDLTAFVRAARRSQSEVWQSAQSFVVAIGNLSKLFWGQQGKFEAEREPLRRALDVESTSLLRPTTMRNHSEHFDERIDEWWSASPGRNFIDGNLGPISVTGDVDRKDFFRGYDPTTGDLSFWGTRLNVADVCAEVSAILDRVAVYLDEWMLPSRPDTD